jgi:hypothetical protein
LLTFEGPKKVDGSFIVKLLVLGGVTAFGLIQSVNDIFDWILSWVLSDGPGMVLSVSAALGVLVFVIFLASLQHRIRASARRWSGDCIRRMPRFAKEEWYALHTIRSAPPGIRGYTRWLIGALLYAGGCYLTLLWPLVHLSTELFWSLFAVSAWTVIAAVASLRLWWTSRKSAHVPRIIAVWTFTSKRFSSRSSTTSVS